MTDQVHGVAAPVDAHCPHLGAHHLGVGGKVVGNALAVRFTGGNGIGWPHVTPVHGWENRCYRERPLLWEADGPILKFRRWAAQFYPA